MSSPTPAQMELVWEANADPVALHQIPDGGTFVRLRGSTLYVATDRHEKKGGLRQRCCVTLPAGKVYWMEPKATVRPKTTKLTVVS